MHKQSEDWGTLHPTHNTIILVENEQGTDLSVNTRTINSVAKSDDFYGCKLLHVSSRVTKIDFIATY